MTTWEKLSVSKPRVKGKKYEVLINVNGRHIEDTLTWTTKAMWDNEKVEYWRDSVKTIEFPHDIHGVQVKVGDNVRGFGFLGFQDGFRIDLSPIVEVGIHDNVLYFGGLSALSFRKFEIVKQ